MPQSLVFDPDETATQTSKRRRFINNVSPLISAIGAIALFTFGDSGTMSGTLGVVEVMLRAVAFSLSICAGIMSALRIKRFRVAPEEYVLHRACYAECVFVSWWMTMALWPALVFAVAAIVRSCINFLINGQVAPLSQGSAFGTYFCLLLLTSFYSQLLWTQQEVRLEKEGIRFNSNIFIEWENVKRVHETPIGFEIFDRRANCFPVLGLVRLNEQQRTLFLQTVARHGFLIEKSAPTNAAPILRLHLIVGATLFTFGVVAWGVTKIDERWVVFVLFVLGLFATTTIESWRGLGKLTKIKPAVNKDSLRLKPGQQMPTEPLSSPLPEIPPSNQ